MHALTRILKVRCAEVCITELPCAVDAGFYILVQNVK